MIIGEDPDWDLKNRIGGKSTEDEKKIEQHRFRSKVTDYIAL